MTEQSSIPVEAQAVPDQHRQIVEAIAKQWDGCLTDMHCVGEIDIGATIRSDGVPHQFHAAAQLVAASPAAADLHQQSHSVHLAGDEAGRTSVERGVNAPSADGWSGVARHGMPPCDGETVFIGINTAGFACCFNEVTHDGVCSMQGPELSTVQMSGLQWWRALERPAKEQQ